MHRFFFWDLVRFLHSLRGPVLSCHRVVHGRFLFEVSEAALVDVDTRGPIGQLNLEFEPAMGVVEFS